MALRYAVAIALGAVATFGLLMLMRAVIADPEAAQDTGIKGEVLDFVRLVQDREVIVKDRQIKPPPPPDEPPPNQPRPDINTDASIGAEITSVQVDVTVEAGASATSPATASTCPSSRWRRSIRAGHSPGTSRATSCSSSW